MDILTQLDTNIHRLLERINALEQEVGVLTEKNNQQRQEMMQTHGELIALQDKYRKLQLAYTMIGGEEERDKAKVHISNMIAQLDRAIEQLKQ